MSERFQSSDEAFGEAVGVLRGEVVAAEIAVWMASLTTAEAAVRIGGSDGCDGPLADRGSYT